MHWPVAGLIPQVVADFGPPAPGCFAVRVKLGDEGEFAEKGRRCGSGRSFGTYRSSSAAGHTCGLRSATVSILEIRPLP